MSARVRVALVAGEVVLAFIAGAALAGALVLYPFAKAARLVLAVTG